jgi:hypothetical protein
MDARAVDDAPRKLAVSSDPLWGMAIASGLLFAILAALIAFG